MKKSISNAEYSFSKLPALKTKSIVYRFFKNSPYLHKPEDRIDDLKAYEGSICIPLAIDTEFTGDLRTGVTVQMVGVHEENGTIYDHKDLQNYAHPKDLRLRHKPIRHDFAPLDHLEQHDHQVKLKIYDRVHKTDLNGDKLPFCQFDIYAHFALA